MHHVFIADARRMPELHNGSVHLVVTSPPYWQLKDYGAPGQIGFGDSYEEYVAKLNEVWAECDRVLHPGCRLCVNVGDQFARAAHYGRYKIIPIRTEIIRFCESIGLDYMGAVIWQKLTTCNTSGGASIMGSYPFPRNGAIMIDYEFILVFKKQGKAPVVTREKKESARLTHEQWVEYFAGHWRIPGERQDAHLAAFPEEIPRRLIRMYSFPGERVLDPFLGSGTTVKVAEEEGRLGIGYEINGEFESVIRQKLGLDAPQRALPLETSTPAVQFSRRDGEALPPPGNVKDCNRAPLVRTPGAVVVDFGSRIDGRSRSGKLMMEVVRELSAQDDWAALTERERMAHIVRAIEERTGAQRSLVSAGVRNALQTLKGFAELVRGRRCDVSGETDCAEE